jgi:hypothetical protein
MAVASKAPITFFPRIEPTIPHEVQRHLQLIYSRVNNFAVAFQHIASAQVGGAPSGETLQQIINQTTISQGGGLPGAGLVNDQTGGLTRSAYTTQQSDSGSLVVIGTASVLSPIAVTLNSSVTLPWSTFISNIGVSLATLTPQTGVINYLSHPGAASMPLPPGFWCMVGFDGTDFWGARQSSAIGTLVLNYLAITAAYTIDPFTDHQVECTAGTFTVTLPSAAGLTGQAFAVKNSGTGTITVAAAPGEFIDGSPTQPLTQYDNITVLSNNANWIIV